MSIYIDNFTTIKYVHVLTVAEVAQNHLHLRTDPAELLPLQHHRRGQQRLVRVHLERQVVRSVYGAPQVL